MIVDIILKTKWQNELSKLGQKADGAWLYAETIIYKSRIKENWWDNRFNWKQ